MVKSAKEKPWGSRLLYSGSGEQAAFGSVAGPGMVVKKRPTAKTAPRARGDTAVAELERAALEGLTVEQYRQRRRAHIPSSTKEKAPPASRAAAPAPDVDDHGEDGGWFYQDDSGSVQGPFGPDRIRAWVADGYIKPDTKVRRWDVVEFNPLSAFTSAPGWRGIRLNLDPDEASDSGGSSSGRRAADRMNVGPGGMEADAWQRVTEGQPPFENHFWLHTVTGEKRPVLPAATSAAPGGGAAATALDSLGGYGSASDSDD